MGIVKLKIIASRKDNLAMIEILSKLFKIPPDLIEGPIQNKQLTLSFLTFNLDKIILTEVLDQ
jgi:hypothetical protein